MREGVFLCFEGVRQAVHAMAGARNEEVMVRTGSTARLGGVVTLRFEAEDSGDDTTRAAQRGQQGPRT